MASPAPNTRLGAATWSTLMLNDGEIILPPDAWEGACIVTAKSAQKLDQQSASGKDKAKTVQKGREPVDIGITLNFTARGWPKVENVLMQIDPNGPARGGPFKSSHPNLELRQVKALMIKEVGDIEWKGQAGSVKIAAVEWEEPKKVLKGGVKKSSTVLSGSTVEVLQVQITSLQLEIAAIDAELADIQSAAAEGLAPNLTKQQRLLKQREQLVSTLARDRSALAQAMAADQNTSDLPTATKAGASQNTVPGQAATKAPKPNPYAAPTGPNANP